jgi:U32 family peptidase
MAELLAPAVNVEALDAAIGEGADAVYMGLKSFNARLRSSNFAWNQFEAAVESVHRQKKKIFVTVNTVVEEWELERLYRFLTYLNKIGPDGIIVQDMGVIRMVQEFFPNLRMHASTQLNAASANAVNLLGKAGLKRVVLARELGLEEVTAIRQRTNSELEVFVHGALCVSESGLCLFSSYLGGKSANRGMCTQACRRFYSAEVPGGLAQGYYFSPHDLQLIEKIPDLVKAGVDSFKIEGRMKSAEYVGSVTAAYRYVLDNWEADKKGAIAAAKRMLSTDFARTKTMYWYNSPDADTLLDPKQAGGTGIYLGKIERMKTLEVRSIADGDESALEDTDQELLETETSNPEYVKEKTTFAVLRGGSYDPDAGDSIRLHRKDDSNRESYKVKQV